MQNEILTWGLLLAALGAALVAGVFLTFSDFVMRALNRTDPKAGIEAMQIINREVFRSLFMVLLVGSAPLALLLAVYGVVGVGGRAAIWLVMGAVFYGGGVMAVTVLRNVPMNEKLDAMDHRSAAAHFYWQTYVRAWTGWNHVRGVASLGTAACYLIGAFILGRPS